MLTVSFFRRTVTRCGVCLMVLAALCDGDRIAASETHSWMFDSRWSALAEPVFRRIGSEDEFSEALAIAQDADGFLWVGTQRGLIRWDGYRGRVFKADANDPDALHDVYINALYNDNRGSLWIGTRSSGLARYDRAQHRFVTYPVASGGFAYPMVYAITGDDAGNLWVATGSGEGPGSVQRLDIETGNIQTLLSSADGNDARARALLIDDAGTLWIGTLGGLLRCENKIACDVIEFPRAAQVRALYESADKTIWIGTITDGVYFLRDGDAHVQRLGDATIRSVFDFVEPVAGELWIASLRDGLFVADIATRKIRHVQHNRAIPTSLPNDVLVKLFRDRSGLVWIGSAAGIATYDPQAAVLTVPSAAIRPEGTSDTWVDVLLPTHDGTIWAGTATEGVYVIDPTGNRPRHLAPDQLHSQVSGLAEAGGRIFIADDDGLARTSPDGNRVERFTFGLQPPPMSINDLVARDDTLWLFSFDGVWTMQQKAAIDAPISLAAFSEQLSDRVGSSAQWETPTRVWLGTRNGLNRIDTVSNVVTRFVAHPGQPSALQNAFVKTLLFDHRHRLWVATATGLYRVSDTETAQPVFTSIRLGNLRTPVVILAAVVADDGAIWVSTTDGLVSVDTDTFDTRVLQRPEGVINQYRTDNAVCATPHGELLFGGIDGITILRPDRLRPWDFHAPIAITDLRVGDKHIENQRDADNGQAPLVIEPSAGGLSVEFAALDYTAPERNRYTYRLDGFDQDWVSTDSRVRTASYTDLPPGNFTLRLRGSNRDGQWADSDIAIPIRVLPPWFRTPWAYAMYAVLFAIALWLAGAWRVRRAARATRMLEKTVVERTSALATANAQLDDARRAAEAATQAKSAFLANMSHEIRTPMNAVLGFAQLGLRQPFPPQALDYFTKVFNAGKNLLGIINDVLDFSKIESGRLVLERVPFDTRKILDEVHTLFSMKAVEQGLRFSIACDDDVPEQLLGDPLRLNQVLVNLVGNAMKFTHAGFVQLSVTTRNDTDTSVTLHFAVKDSGIGMDDAQRARLFMPFSQADSSTTRVYGGTGLGLTISQRIVEHMSGRIEVSSSPGQGSTFAFDATFGRVSAADVSEKMLASTETEVHSIGGGARVLLVEDNVVNQQLAIELLRSAGASVGVASTGNEAVQLAKQECFDCIFMDIEMPGLDGYAATEQIRRDGRNGNVPIIAMTAHASADFRAKCMAAGMNDYLAKPIDAHCLVEMLARWTTAPRS